MPVILPKKEPITPLPMKLVKLLEILIAPRVVINGSNGSMNFTKEPPNLIKFSLTLKILLEKV